MVKKFAVIDAETDPFLFGRFPEPFVWGFYDGEVYEQFDTTESLVRFLWDYEGVVYAHNGGRFDFFFLLPFIEPDQEVMLINGRIAKVKLGACQLRDSYNILPVPLSAYEKDDVDYSIFEAGEREKPHNKKIIEAYLRSDCVYTWNIVNAFLERYGMVLTQASASMKSYRDTTGADVPHSTEHYFEFFKPFYYGGRVQCFEHGVKDEPFQVYDINSAYPAAMLKPHPCTLEYVRVIDPTLGMSHTYKHGFFQVRGVSEGAFPWREKVGTKLLYPDDDVVRDYFITGWELSAALELNAFRGEVVEAYVHNEVREFSDYILPLYEERKRCKAQGDKAGDLLAKLAMNSLYGKFGSDPGQYVKTRLWDESRLQDLYMGGISVNGRAFHYDGQPCEGLVFGSRELELWERRYYNVATAASITGCVRAFLFKSLRAVKGALYCDTDSIACRDGSGLVCSKELGDWKHEGDFVRWAIAGRKLYAFFSESGIGQDFDNYSLADNPGWGKLASKGAALLASDIVAIAKDGKASVTYTRDAPTFSVKKGAYFTKRQIKAIKD